MVVEEDGVVALLEALLRPDHGLHLTHGGVQAAVPELVIGIWRKSLFLDFASLDSTGPG